KLPKVDGMEVLRAMKNDPRTRIIPVVVLTSSKEEQDLIDSYSLGANSYIQRCNRGFSNISTNTNAC
ncbi:MAG: Response regulator receiver protein, partial [Candidatus Daviesbacteria bacterium GW2011_GWF2_38_6]